MAQLVGRNCVRCGERIPSSFDARFCPECESPVHDRCMRPPDAAGCPACGVAVAPTTGGPAGPDHPPTPGRPPWPRRLRLFLGAYYTLAVAWGVRNVYHREPSGLDLLVSVGLAVALGWWAIADARGRGRPIPLLARPWFYLLAVPVVPGYVIWSRRWRGVLWMAVHAVCWYGLCAVAMHATGTVLYGGEWWRGVGRTISTW